jgi:hypothetical protein
MSSAMNRSILDRSELSEPPILWRVLLAEPRVNGC